MIWMSKKIVCLVGKSGSGKSSIAKASRNGIVLPSYTTRPRRDQWDTDHIFLTQRGFDYLRDKMVAYTKFNGFEYGATKEQVESYDVYIIDVRGLKMMTDNLGKDKVVSILVRAKDDKRYHRMATTRGRDDAEERIKQDEIEFAHLKEEDFDFIFDNNDEEELADCVGKLEHIIAEIKYKDRVDDEI